MGVIAERMNAALTTVLSGVVVMVCLGGVYAWSIFVPPLKENYGLSTAQTQVIFGLLIAIFTVSMAFGRPLLSRYGPRVVALLAGLVFLSGYALASVSGGRFPLLVAGIGGLAGIATGLGYLVSITVPVAFYPHRKGVVTGVASAGFGAGAIVLSYGAEYLFARGMDVLAVFLVIGLAYGAVIALGALGFSTPPLSDSRAEPVQSAGLLRDRRFIRLFVGIFTGTFAGLMVIGNLKPIGLLHQIENATLTTGVVVLSVANFAGRLFWGWLADRVSGSVLIPLSLLLVGVLTLAIGALPLNGTLYLVLSVAVGFTFGANFVLYARETAQVYGLGNLARVYPLVFLGYGVSGAVGPSVGGFLYDLQGHYAGAATLSVMLCVVVGLLQVWWQRSAE